MSKVIWEPYGDYLTKSNIRRFMDKHGIKSYDALVKYSTDDVARFWDQALEDLGVDWYKPYDNIMDDSGGIAWTKWFLGGKLNIVHNCIDRHLQAGLADKTCLIHEDNDGVVRELSYGELNAMTCKAANALKELGVEKDDCVGLYMPMVPELVAAFFAVLKIGAVAIPIFSGFGPTALAVRLEDAKAKVLFTADGSSRRNKPVRIKEAADKALEGAPSINHQIVISRMGFDDTPMTEGRDLFWHDVVDKQSNVCETEQLDAEARCLIIYTSGTTGKPKGTVHTHGGALAQCSKELGYAFDVKPDSRFFWVTDIGWMMGPWQLIGVQFHSATHMIFEGAPNWPDPDRLWDMVERHKITHLGISPTAIRLLMTYEPEWVEKHDMSTLKYLGSTGEAWDPESYKWFFDKVGGKRCPIINISGGTEILGCLLSPLPITPLKPSTLCGPGLGMDVAAFDNDGNRIEKGIGHLVCLKPAPSMTKAFLNDKERYIETYFSKWDGVWYHGDWAEIDEDGFWFLRGRSDDTLKVAGKRTGPAEIESALLEHPAAMEAAAIGVPDPIKGQDVVCIVVLTPGYEASEELREELKGQVIKHMGKTLKPKDLKFVEALPKTRSAKILRGVIKRKYLGEDIGDIASCENPEAIEGILNAK
jgi:acetyl-CoA synthetase